MTEERRGRRNPARPGDRRRLDIEQTVEAASFMRKPRGACLSHCLKNGQGDRWAFFVYGVKTLEVP